MIKIKRLFKIIVPTVLLLMLALTAHAYNVVDLPENMTFSDALGVFNADEITRITVSDIAEGKYTDLTKDEINEFYSTIQDMTVYRKINPTPFRGISVNIYTNDGVKSYMLNSGLQIGMYGSNNYVCYKLNKANTEKLLYLDSMYRDAEEKVNGEEIHRVTSNDFLKLPSSPWAQPFAREAASKNILPYEFTGNYSENITREQFCILLANLICVKENYSSLDKYMQDQNKPYLKNYFVDCNDADDSVNILYALGIVNGKDESHFDPDGTITREEAATLLCKVAEMYMWIGTETSLTYSDTDLISPWAKFFVTWANEYGIMTGITEEEFNPQGLYTVEQAFATIVRLYNLLS